MLRDELDDMKRIAERNAKIEKLLAEASAGETEEATAPVDPSAPKLYPPLRPWERVINGRREQYRPLTSREVEAENDRLFMESQRRQDEAHAAKVAEAIKEAEREQKRLDKKREYERVTGRRPMKDTISLAEAERRGYIGNGSSHDDAPPGMYGLFASGGQYVKGN